ncbi:MAG TPA: DNA-3-methyladenine glycosylase I [Nitrospiria bacterium]|nr:DNA-3-methyladenine glycosylase I [Nitrospiria bacterium]
MKRAGKPIASVVRCPWPTASDPIYLDYHDREWGVPVHDDRKIYEFLVLEVFQAGLSWRTILYKRENFRKAFAGFDYRKVARFGRREVARLLKDAGIIRNRLKIEAAINNAKRFIEVQREFGSFDAYMWTWVNGAPIVRYPRTLKDYPSHTDEALAWAKDLKRRGFTFLGPTVIYAHMQAVGMVNDHTVDCFRRRESKSSAGSRQRRIP